MRFLLNGRVSPTKRAATCYQRGGGLLLNGRLEPLAGGAANDLLPSGRHLSKRLKECSIWVCRVFIPSLVREVSYEVGTELELAKNLGPLPNGQCLNRDSMNEEISAL